MIIAIAMRMDDLRLLYINIRRNLEENYPNAGKSASDSPRLSRTEERNEARNISAATERKPGLQEHLRTEQRASRRSSAPLGVSERHKDVVLGSSPSDSWAQNGALEKGGGL